jgi:hypothetical protein
MQLDSKLVSHMQWKYFSSSYDQLQINVTEGMT